MKKSIFALFAVATILATGCVKTVSDTRSFSTTIGRDTIAGRYPRTLEQVYQASLAVIQSNGVLVNEYIPHDTTNAVRSLQGRVNDRKVWIRVESIDARTTQVDVQSLNKWGRADLELVHQLEKEIALQLVR